MFLPVLLLNEVLSLAGSHVVLSWTVDVVFGVIQELNPMGEPSGNPGNGEENGVHVCWEAHCPVDES